MTAEELADFVLVAERTAARGSPTEWQLVDAELRRVMTAAGPDICAGLAGLLHQARPPKREPWRRLEPDDPEAPLPSPLVERFASWQRPWAQYEPPARERPWAAAIALARGCGETGRSRARDFYTLTLQRAHDTLLHRARPEPEALVTVSAMPRVLRSLVDPLLRTSLAEHLGCPLLAESSGVEALAYLVHLTPREELDATLARLRADADKPPVSGCRERVDAVASFVDWAASGSLEVRRGWERLQTARTEGRVDPVLVVDSFVARDPESLLRRSGDLASTTEARAEVCRGLAGLLRPDLLVGEVSRPIYPYIGCGTGLLERVYPEDRPWKAALLAWEGCDQATKAEVTRFIRASRDMARGEAHDVDPIAGQRHVEVTFKLIDHAASRNDKRLLRELRAHIDCDFVVRAAWWHRASWWRVAKNPLVASTVARLKRRSRDPHCRREATRILDSLKPIRAPGKR